jgi:Lysozyme like domain
MVLPVPASAVGVKYTMAQMAFFLQGAGMPQADLAKGVAVGWAESSGRGDAIGGPNTDGSFDYGLWQINGKAHPDLMTSDEQWWSPGYNAQMAVKVYQDAGNSFKPWSTYGGISYQLNMIAAQAAADAPDNSIAMRTGGGNTVTVNPLTEPLVNIGSAVGGIAGAIVKAGAWMANRSNWQRVAYVGLGASLLIGSLMVVAKPAISSAAGPVLDVVPGGGVIKTAAKSAAKAGTS